MKVTSTQFASRRIRSGCNGNADLSFVVAEVSALQSSRV
jgi:hypothetical protein